MLSTPFLLAALGTESVVVDRHRLISSMIVRNDPRRLHQDLYRTKIRSKALALGPSPCALS